MRFTFDGDLSLDDISRMFEENDWGYAVDGCYGYPTKEDLQKAIFRMVETMEDQDLDYYHIGRLALVRDDEVENTYQVFITVGYLYVDEGAEAA